jgi:hypothetical protein
MVITKVIHSDDTQSPDLSGDFEIALEPRPGGIKVPSLGL